MDIGTPSDITTNGTTDIGRESLTGAPDGLFRIMKEDGISPAIGMANMDAWSTIIAGTATAAEGIMIETATATEEITIGIKLGETARAPWAPPVRRLFTIQI